MFDRITSFLKTHEIDLLQTQQRMAVVFHVENNQDELLSFIDNLWFHRKLIISPYIEGALPAERAVEKLGEEYELVIFDAREVFYPDALGVVSGVLCGGGYLLILLPEKSKWNKRKSVFLEHVDKLLVNQPGVHYFKDKDSCLNDFSLAKPVFENKLASDISPYRSDDQKRAVESIVNSIRNKSDYCCVLTSGRGRGKSSALGFISALLLERDRFNILISAPKLRVADTLFEYLQKHCPGGVPGRTEFTYNDSTVKFIAPDLLLEKLPEADVLFIDEAAVIPVSMLDKLLKHYPKIIFSTTTHGYEGTGRGFILKFYKLLDDVKPGWDNIELFQPIRWSKDDKLEKWIEEVLFLNTALSVKPAIPDKVSDCQVQLVNRFELLENKKKLSNIFSLLIFAHYRTSPSDFQYLLDSEDIRIYNLEYKNISLGIVAINQEGGFDSALSTAIYRGERRPQGNLLAQTLCFHGGSEGAAGLSYARVMRIAIHPALQGLGLGSYLLKQVIKKEQISGMDVIGSSFSATGALLDFWDKAGLSILRLGFSRDHITAAHSAVMAKALTPDGEKVIDSLKLKFNYNISLWLQGPLSGLTNKIKNHTLLCSNSHKSSQLVQGDLDDVDSFACFNRNYEACMPAIMRFINTVILPSDSVDKVLNDQERKIVYLSKKYMSDWKMIISDMNKNNKSQIASKAQAIKLLRLSLKKLRNIKPD